VASGKPRQGQLTLHAFHEGGKVIIEISDDGSGIDPKRIRAKAIQAKLLPPEQTDRLSDSELVNLIFLPGFSTAEKVTQFSGRGVGMDVVRTNIEKIGGTVSIDSRLSQGTTLKMKIPLTLAIIPALTITSGGDRYAIPQVSLLELVRLESDQAQRGVENIQGAPVYRLRGKLLPLVYLNQQLGLDVRRTASETAGDTLSIIVLQADDRQFGLIVDAIHDTEEIVVKPLQKQLKGVGLFAGATIMGDGKVALILDVLALAQRARVVSGARERVLADKSGADGATGAQRESLLLFALRDGSRMGIPLSLVDRLEEFPRSALERVGSQRVVQYRDEILPLVDVASALRRCRHAERMVARRVTRHKLAEQHDNGGPVQVVVYSVKNQRVGLVVDSIIDIVEEAVISRCPATRPGVRSTAVINDRVTEFLDVETIIASAMPNDRKASGTLAAEA
jgi:two-component system chemotaxis sensor kinase CheA